MPYAFDCEMQLNIFKSQILTVLFYLIVWCKSCDIVLQDFRKLVSRPAYYIDHVFVVVVSAQTTRVKVVYYRGKFHCVCSLRLCCKV